MSADVPEQVRIFLSEFLKMPLERLRPEVRLEEDLGVTGDDALELLRECAARFGVDLTGLQFYRHFGPEGGGCNPLRILFPPAGMSDYRHYPVTIDHLVRVAQTKRWFSPPHLR